MKETIVTPSSSAKSSTTMETSPSETRDTFYFPGCRKDANCICDMCLASIKATLDLVPQSAHRSSLSKLSVSRHVIHRSPVSFPSGADLLTPTSTARIRPMKLLSSPRSPEEGSTLREKVKRRKREFGYGVLVMRFFLGLILVFGLDYGVSWMVSKVLKPVLSPELVMNLGEQSKNIEGLNRKFVFLTNELEGLVGEKVETCGSVNSVWKINQDGLLLNSRCILYKSASEEVSIWGWPLQTSGLLTAEHSFRSLTILSGRVTEWPTGKPDYFLQTANNYSLWTHGKWESSVVQLDQNTWILEYRQSFFLENSRVVSAALDFLRQRLMRMYGKLKQGFWLPHEFTSWCLDSRRTPSIHVPT